MFCEWPINREVRIFLKRTHTFFTSQLKNANKWNYKGTFLRMIKYLFWCNIFRFMDYNIWLYCIGIFCLKTFFTFAQCFLLWVVVPLNRFFFFICNNCKLLFYFYYYCFCCNITRLFFCTAHHYKKTGFHFSQSHVDRHDKRWNNFFLKLKNRIYSL